MRHRQGKQQIRVQNVKQIEVSAIDPYGIGASSYQRVIRFITDTGTLEILVEAKERSTLCFAADPQPVDEDELHLDKEGEEYD